MAVILRKAGSPDIPALELLIDESVRTLQAADYTAEQIAGALGTVFGVDTQLIRDGTYFVAEDGSQIVACGGWSRRKTPFGSDHGPEKDDSLLDPVTEAARIRAFFVRPGWARRGIGSRILRACEEDAAAHGFRRLELVATLTGEPLYRVHGFEAQERLSLALPNGANLPVVRMVKGMDRI